MGQRLNQKNKRNNFESKRDKNIEMKIKKMVKLT